MITRETASDIARAISLTLDPADAFLVVLQTNTGKGMEEFSLQSENFIDPDMTVETH